MATRFVLKSGRTTVNGAFQPRAVNFSDNLLLTAEQTGVVPSEGIGAVVQTILYPCLTISLDGSTGIQCVGKFCVPCKKHWGCIGFFSAAFSWQTLPA